MKKTSQPIQKTDRESTIICEIGRDLDKVLWKARSYNRQYENVTSKVIVEGIESLIRVITDLNVEGQKCCECHGDMVVVTPPGSCNTGYRCEKCKKIVEDVA